MLSTVTNSYETLGYFKEFNILSEKIGLGAEAQIQHKMDFFESCLGDTARQFWEFKKETNKVEVGADITLTVYNGVCHSFLLCAMTKEVAEDTLAWLLRVKK
uniref:Uncharacterized protein n=1 Tax=Proboscia inermis TaxID=420281 RepID=A0A7S0G9Z3_9STRA|mmetsp:Transcript_23955/g.24418  ORF Transcript_23955/g.24418 Transcript_23955/m.24418 type:complete len:102 (+) Transcript_23955:206-511(+)